MKCVHQVSHRVWNRRFDQLRGYPHGWTHTNPLAFLGLRGRMEAGWSRMNDLIVIQASQVRPNALVRRTRTVEQSHDLRA